MHDQNLNAETEPHEKEETQQAYSQNAKKTIGDEKGFTVVDRRQLTQDENDEVAGEEVQKIEDKLYKTKYVEELEKKLKEKEEQLQNYIKAYKSAERSMEEYKTRLRRDREDILKRERGNMLKKLLSVMDNFERSIDSAQKIENSVDLVAGLKLIQADFLKLLSENGVEVVSVLGARFDPAVAEAVSTKPVEAPEQEGIVVEELQKGFKLDDILLRPCRVIVGICKPKE